MKTCRKKKWRSKILAKSQDPCQVTETLHKCSSAFGTLVCTNCTCSACGDIQCKELLHFFYFLWLYRFLCYISKPTVHADHLTHCRTDVLLLEHTIYFAQYATFCQKGWKSASNIRSAWTPTSLQYSGLFHGQVFYFAHISFWHVMMLSNQSVSVNMHQLALAFRKPVDTAYRGKKKIIN